MNPLFQALPCLLLLLVACAGTAAGPAASPPLEAASAASAPAPAAQPQMPEPDTAEPFPTAEKEPSLDKELLVILAGGDVTLGYHLPEYYEELRKREGISKEAYWRYPFERLASLTKEADLFWVNFEGTLTTADEPTPKNFNFRADPEEATVLKEGGVDIVHLANNHAYDFGPEGLIQTLTVLQKAGIISYGAGEDMAAARTPAIVHRNGVRIGFLGYLYMGEHSIEPESLYAATEKAGTAGTHKDIETLKAWVDEDIRALRPHANLVFVSFHWGREGRNLIESYQRDLARTAAQAGADLVVGHHPHALQGFEYIGDVPVAYSLGNLMFAGNWNPRRKDTALLEIRVRRKDAGSYALTIRYIPLSVDHQPDHPFQPYILPEDKAARVQGLIECYLTASEEGACEAELTPGSAMRGLQKQTPH